MQGGTCARPLPGDRLERVWAWGRAASGMSYVYRPSTAEGVAEVFETARRHGLRVGLRGAGRSYGDAAMNDEGLCLDLTRMNRILAWDPAAGVVRVEPGVTFRQLWQYAIGDGWWPAVVPGSMTPTLGGSAAMNIHGKNNWKVGPIGDHVRELELLLPTGEIKRCSREENAELFHAAIGGFGMLGCLVHITLALKRVHSGLLAVEAFPARSLDEMFALFEERLERADYLVGWIDAFGAGAGLGRGLVHQATYLAPDEDPAPAQTLRVDAQELPDTFLGTLPKAAMWRLMRPLVNDVGVRCVNTAQYRLNRWRGRHTYRQSHAAFAFLLDYVPNWHHAYGPGGLIQYQSFIPAEHAPNVFRDQIALAQRRGIVPYLGVFKRHRRDPFLMTHAVDGYSLALDFKVTPRRRAALWQLAGELDALVVEAGGRFYFAKDSTLSPRSLVRYVREDRVQRFLALKHAVDPEGMLQTNLYRRLFGSDAGAFGNGS